MTTFEGKFIGKDIKVAIVVARFNEFITSKLLDGAKDTLIRNEVKEENIDVYWVPGAFEIPFITKKLVATNKYDGIITLGSVIRGSTSHYDLVCNEVAEPRPDGGQVFKDRQGNVVATVTKDGQVFKGAVKETKTLPKTHAVK